MGLKPSGHLVFFAVNRMFFHSLNRHYNGFVHFVGDYCPLKGANHWVASFPAISRSRAMVSARAMVFLCRARTLTSLTSLVRLSIMAVASAARSDVIRSV